MSAKKKTPVWAWVGCGCILLIALVVVAIGGAGFLGFSQLKSMVEDMADPLARDEATMRLLGAEALPEGWHSHVFFQIPFLVKIAILTDGTPPAAIEGDFEEKAQALENLRLRRDEVGRNVFFYFKVKGRGDADLEDLVSGQASRDGQTSTQVDLDIEIKPDVALGDGSFEIGNQKFEWRAQTGTMQVMGGELEGIYSAIRVLCYDGDSSDVLWFQGHELAPDMVNDAGEITAEEITAEGSEASSAAVAADSASGSMAGADFVPYEDRDLSGTPADQEALNKLLSHFQLCGEI